MVLRALIYALMAATLTYYSGIRSELSAAKCGALLHRMKPAAIARVTPLLWVVCYAHFR